MALADAPTEMVLAITDQGRGFSTEHIRKVGAYMQFDRKMQEQQGLGLGLVIAKTLATVVPMRMCTIYRSEDEFTGQGNLF